MLVGAEVTQRASAALPARRTSRDQCRQLATAAHAAAAVASALRASACCSSSAPASTGTSAASGGGSLASTATVSSGEAAPAPADHACATGCQSARWTQGCNEARNDERSNQPHALVAAVY